MADYSRDLVKLLGEAGWRRIDGGRCSHEEWRHSETGRVVVIVPRSKSRHTANEVLRQAGVPKAL